jgi:hypothetical protein
MEKEEWGHLAQRRINSLKRRRKIRVETEKKKEKRKK